MQEKIELIPAIMPQSLEEIESKVILVKGTVKTVQLDLMDGKYVPEKTWPFSDKSFFKSENEIELPFWDDINYELDLMVLEPEKYLDLWLKFSPVRIIFHYSSIKDFKKIEEFSNQISGFIEVGFAIQYEDNLDEVFKYIKKGTVRFVQCMGIGKIGYQGEPFNERILEIIQSIRKRIPDLPISIDGGVSEKNIKKLIEAGITRIVSGSAVFGSGSAKENIERFNDLL